MGTASVQIGEWLGVPAPSTNAKVFALVEGRLDASVMDRLLHLGFERKEMDAIIIPTRTLQHRRSRGEKLTVEESDRVLGLLQILALTEEVYGGRERALAWLRRAHPRLGDRVPLLLLNTNAGSHMVEELLIQIDEGMFI
jgi:putative toxin-antitoxin system antitoxin component (TIGR02293 family)